VNQAKTDDGTTPLCRGPRQHCGSAACPGADVNQTRKGAKTDADATSAFVASPYGHLQILMILLDARADDSTVMISRGI
jgi:hypothetical protein